MNKIFSSFVLVLFLVLISSGLSFSQMSSIAFFCKLQPGGAVCSFGDITLTVDTRRYPKFVCDYPGCVNFYGEVVHATLPFLKIETFEESQRKATVLLKKSLTLSEKINYYINSLFGKTGLGLESDKMMQVLKEKLAEASKTQSEKVLVDFTTYFITEIAKDISLQKKPNAAAVSMTVMYLANLAKEGKLADFLSLYFYLRAKHPELLVSSNIEESKKAPLPVMDLYLHPEKFNEAVSGMIYIAKDLMERMKSVQAGGKPNTKASVNLVNGLSTLRAEGFLWGLDETIPDLVARFANYLPNYEKVLKESQIPVELKEIQENLYKKEEDKKVEDFVFLFFTILFFVFLSGFLYLMRKKKKGGAKDE